MYYKNFNRQQENPQHKSNSLSESGGSIRRYLLRDYQQALIQQVFIAWRQGNKRLMMMLATGAGKTFVFAIILLEFVLKNEPVLVLVHRHELLLQARQTIEAITGLPVGVIKAGLPVNPLALVQVASIQTLIRRKTWPQAALVVVDEAHHSCAQSCGSVFQAYAGAYILGVTATPARIDGQGFKYLYDSLIYGPSVRELIDAGYLAPFKLFAAQNIIKTKGIRTVGGDFNQAQLAQQASSALVLGDVVKTWCKHALYKKTVVFGVNVAHSQEIAEAYRNAGVMAEHIDGETPHEERQAILSRFREGEILILTNCGIISEGFDVPSIEAVQCVRPTQSLGLWLQMVGRGLRPHPGKEHAIILEHTLNWLNHGLPDEEHEWSLEPISLDCRRWALECPACSHIFRPLPHEQKTLIASCPNCLAQMEFEVGTGGDLPPPRLILQDQQLEVEEIRVEADPKLIAGLHWLREVQEDRGHKPAWVYYQLIENYPGLGLPELRECAKVWGYRPGWAWHRWQELQANQNSGGGAA